MAIKFLEEPVRENITLFVNKLKDIEQQPLANEKKFQAWLDCHSGKFFFIKPNQDVKPVTLSYHYYPSSGEIQFLIEDKNGQFFLGDLSDKARNIFISTMKSLEEVAKALKGPSTLKVKLSALSKLMIEIQTPHDRKILMEAWHHPLDRMHAESLLKAHPIGSFLFRKDPFAEMLEHQLKEHFRKPIKCFTLTVLEKEQKISDHTLVFMDGKWQVYNDDPNLRQPRFSALRELLNTNLLKKIAKYPLYHDAYEPL